MQLLDDNDYDGRRELLDKKIENEAKEDVLYLFWKRNQ